MLQRCIQENEEEFHEAENSTEPHRCILLGGPGASKSQTIKWLRAFFETVCGWDSFEQVGIVLQGFYTQCTSRAVVWAVVPLSKELVKPESRVL